MVILLVNVYRKLFKPPRILEVYCDDSNEKNEFMNERPDKYKVVEAISIDEGVDKILSEVPKYEAVLLNDIPSELKNDIL